MGLLGSLIIGLIAGALAGRFVRGGGFGIIGDIVIGLVGGVVGGLIFTALGLASSGVLGEIVVSFIGAVVFLGITRALFRAPV